MRPYFYRDRWIEYAVAAGIAVLIIVIHLTGLLRPVEDLVLAGVAPIARGVYLLETGVSTVFENVFTDKQTQVNELTHRVTELESELAARTAVEEENVTLRRQLGVQAKRSEQRILAHVLGERPAAQFSKRLLVDVGTRDGVKAGDAVVVDGALVGFIERASDILSEVMLITDPNSTVPAYVGSPKSIGLVKGDIGFSRITMTQLDRTVHSTSGSTVATSGENGSPKDILIGTVASSLTQDRDTYQTVVITPAADLSNLSVIFILIQ